ncbi:type II toxin-antitoxin system PemK/MazF family toxin [Mumia sp. Pv 4-285]|uniref:type II toxin-antitoxin system PemK/MazF family toxin n=1 Tax=Mumia qirimensis TaxID=3234852 RepID=UPI00351D7EA7
MLTPGDVVDLELGAPAGSEAGLRRPAIVVTADRILRGGPNVVQVVPITRTIRDSGAEVVIEPDQHNGLAAASSAQCQHVRSVAVGRVESRRGNVGPIVLNQIRGVLGVILDI